MRALPAWRTDLEVRLREDGGVEVRDPRLHQVFSLDRRDWLVAQLFDGRRDAQTIETMLGLHGWKVSARRVAQIAVDYAEIYLLDTPEARNAELTADNRPPWSNLAAARRKLKVLPQAEPGARWACHSCGACCHGLAVELSSEEERRIDAALYADLLQDGKFVERAFIDPDQPARRVLRKRPDSDACVFLERDGLCAVHARQGMAYKPDACQAFPFLLLHPPKGPPRLGLRVNCESMAKSFERGPLLSSYLPGLVPLLSRTPSQRVARELLLFKRLVPFAELDAICRAIRTRLAAEGTNPTVLAEIDRAYLGGRVARSRQRYGRVLLAHMDAEENADVPVEEGALLEQVSRVPNGLRALRAMRDGRKPPKRSPRVQAFLAAQMGHVLSNGGVANVPDAGLGLVILMLGLEASLHAIGKNDPPARANLAFLVFSAPLLELTTHAWPILDAIDRRYARRLRKEP